MSGPWQPIETAPKDGTEILLGYFPSFEGLDLGAGRMVVARWHSIAGKWIVAGKVFMRDAGYFSPTHWMLLPAGPADVQIPACTWAQQDHEGGDSWETDCGNAFWLDDGPPTENSMRYCCYCGKPLIEERFVPEPDEDEEIENVHD